MHANIFIERNFGNGEGQAFPPMAFWQRWINRWLASQAALSNEHLKIIGHRLVFRGSQPDEGCSDPRARNPKIIMTLVMPKQIDFNGKQFDDFIVTCWKLARAIKGSGENSSLSVEIPELLKRDK